MMRRYFRRLQVFVLLTGVLVSLADGQAVSLAECLKRAQQFSYVLKAARRQTQAVQKEAQLSRAANLPQISGVLEAQNHRLSDYSFLQQSSLVQADWALGSFLLKTEQSLKQEALAQEQNQLSLRLQIAAQTVDLFVEALKQEKIFNLLQERLKRMEMHRQVARALWQAGNKTELDVLQTEAQIFKLKEKISQALNQRRKAIQELALFIGWPEGKQLKLQSIAAERISEQPLPDLNEVRLEGHPLLKMLQLKQQAIGLQKKSIRAGQLPHLQLSAGFIVDRDPTADGNYWLAAAGIQLPIFRWNATGLALEKVEVQQMRLLNERQALQRRLKIEARKLRIELGNLKKILEFQKARRQKSAQALQLARANYKAGLITNLEFLSIQEEQTHSQIEVQTTQLAFARTLAHFLLVTNQQERMEGW